jgi:hypothetical protein
MIGSVWQLTHDGEVVAELEVTSGDFPWLNAHLKPKSDFEKLRPLFNDELRRLDQVDHDPAAWEAAQLRIRQSLTLIAPDGHQPPEILLHIDGADAWWRWSDEPFPRPPAAAAKS